MNLVIKSTAMTVIVSMLFALSACAPGVGSEEWCNAMKEKPKADWTANEAGDYTKYCLLGAAEPGSAEWCEKMKGKSDSEMTVEEAKTYAKHCLLNR